MQRCTVPLKEINDFKAAVYTKDQKVIEKRQFLVLGLFNVKKLASEIFSGVFYNVSKFKIRALPLASFISIDIIFVFLTEIQIDQTP